MAPPSAERAGSRSVVAGDRVQVRDQRVDAGTGQRRDREHRNASTGGDAGLAGLAACLSEARPVGIRLRGHTRREVELVAQHRERRVAEVCARRGERGVERLAHVDDPEHAIRPAGLEPRATQSLPLDRVDGFAEPRRIDDGYRQAVEREMLAERIARRARDVGDDRRIVTREPVQQARLARVRRTRDRDAEPVAQHRARARRARERREIGEQRVDRGGAFAAGVEANLLVRKVEPRFDLHAQMRECRLQSRHLRRELAVERAQRGARRGRRSRSRRGPRPLPLAEGRACRSGKRAA